MYESIMDAVSREDWSAAKAEIEKVLVGGQSDHGKCYDDIFCILAAAVFQQEKNEEKLFYYDSGSIPCSFAVHLA